MKSELLTFEDPKAPVSEIFRTLRTNIQFMNTDKRMETLLVTSTSPGEGKSYVTSNLAVTFAQAGKKVILIDADMRKGRQYKIFNVYPKPGLSNYLSNMDENNIETSETSIMDYIQETGVGNLHIISAGNIPPNPSELLVSYRMRKLLEILKGLCDIVIIDGTPCELVTDSIILSKFVDSTIIVTEQRVTKKDVLLRIVKNIQNVGGKVAGIVVNKVDISAKKYNQSYYYGSMGGSEFKKSSKTSSRIEEKKNNLYKDMKIKENMDLKNKTNLKTSHERKNNVKIHKQTNSKGEVSTKKSTTGSKTSDIMNLVNNYIETEKHNQERKY